MLTLPNGLRVVHSYQPRTAMVCVHTLYDVGSRDERSGVRGIAHLFEHLMFGGSAHAASFDNELQKAGGTSNAYTSADFTNFYCLLPAANIETALWLEADRMLAPRLDLQALDVQRKVVVEEFKQRCLNQPYGDVEHLLRPMVYGTHPYAVPVIGEDPQQILDLSLEQANDWFHAHYSPNNAVIAICGNISEERAYALVEKWYGDIPARPIASRSYADPAPLTEAAAQEVYRPVPQALITRSYLMDPYGTRQYYAADMLTDVLASGTASRFYRKLLMGTDLFTSVDAVIWGSEHPGLLTISAMLRRADAESRRRAIEAIDLELERMCADGPTEREVQRSKNRYETARTFALMDYGNRAAALALATLHGNSLRTDRDRYNALTPDDVRQAARDILAHGRSASLTVLPAEV